MTVLPIHILAGVLALGFGYVALYAAKGATLHRKSGMLKRQPRARRVWTV